jgi:hypothetical protein
MKHCPTFALSGLLLLVGALNPMRADTPVVTLLSPAPNSTIFVPPYTHTLTFRIQHDELKDVHVLKVKVNSVFVVDVSGNPFGNDNLCHANLTSIPGVGCTPESASSAVVSVPWQVTALGDNVIEISIRHGGSLEAEEEHIEVVLLSASYPAPPSVANAFINSTPDLKSGAAKVRGCVLNQVAEKHAKGQQYGPAPGPYNDPKIRNDVRNWWTGCGGAPHGLVLEQEP